MARLRSLFVGGLVIVANPDFWPHIAPLLPKGLFKIVIESNPHEVDPASSKVSKSKRIQQVSFRGLIDNKHWNGSKSCFGKDLLEKYDIFSVILRLQSVVEKTQHTPLKLGGPQYPPNNPPLKSTSKNKQTAEECKQTDSL